MRTIYIDIETVPLPVSEREFMRPSEATIKLGNLKDPAKIAAKIQEANAEFDAGVDAALDSVQARIALIGYAVDDGEVKYAESDDEGKLLETFWRLVDGGGFADADTEIVGHNIRFDASMLVHRSWLRGVETNSIFVSDLCKRYPSRWMDTMTRWQLGDNKAGCRSLRVLCQAFGITVKESPVKAERFWEWWAKDKPACIEYNRQDVEAVRQLWAKIK